MHENSGLTGGKVLPERELYPVPEIAHLLGGITELKVWQLLAAGEIGSVKIGSRRLVPRAELDKYLARLAAAA